MRHKCQVRIQCDCIQCKRKNQHNHYDFHRHEEDFHPENTDLEYDFFEEEISIDDIFEKDIFEMEDNR